MRSPYTSSARSRKSLTVRGTRMPRNVLLPVTPVMLTVTTATVTVRGDDQPVGGRARGPQRGHRSHHPLLPVGGPAARTGAGGAGGPLRRRAPRPAGADRRAPLPGPAPERHRRGAGGVAGGGL